jgi:dienelactone hydrolase
VPQASVVHPPARPIDLVEDLKGPVLTFWGDADETVGIDHVREYVRLAQAANPEFRSEVLPGLKHGFLGAADLKDSADPATETWRKTLLHLRANLFEQATS